MSVISGGVPMRDGIAVSPNPMFTYRRFSCPPVSAEYRPLFSGNIRDEGDHPKIENCMACVCPDRVRSMQGYPDSAFLQCVGS